MSFGLAARVATVGVAYYAGAWFGVQYSAPTSGIALIWPPNAVLLAAFLLARPREWPWYAAVVVAAELVAAVPTFPLVAATAFSLVNVFEATVAAAWLRRIAGPRFRFDRLRDGVAYVVIAGIVVPAVAALAGAAIYLALGATEAGFLAQWRLWWFGDALGLLILGPAILTAADWWRRRDREVAPSVPGSTARVAEATAFVGAAALLTVAAFAPSELGAAAFFVEPALLVALGIVAAVRYGVTGASVAVAVIAAVAVVTMSVGGGPDREASALRSILSAQGVLAVLAFVSVGSALVLDELRRQRARLERQEVQLRDQNERLERSVTERTEAWARAARDLEHANARLARLATTDYLTELPNRRAFEETGERERRRAAADGVPVAVLVFDLDRFKTVNDRYGHAVGDRVLRAVAAPVRTALRPSDLLARTGGEEFSVLLVDADARQATEVAERIRRALETTTVEHDGASIVVTASFGVAAVRTPDEPLASLAERADAAMYRAKRAGRNRVAN